MGKIKYHNSCKTYTSMHTHIQAIAVMVSAENTIQIAWKIRRFDFLFTYNHSSQLSCALRPFSIIFLFSPFRRLFQFCTFSSFIWAMSKKNSCYFAYNISWIIYFFFLVVVTVITTSALSPLHCCKDHPELSIYNKYASMHPCMWRLFYWMDKCNYTS